MAPVLSITRSLARVWPVAELVPMPVPLVIVIRPVPSGPLTMALPPSRTVLLPTKKEPPWRKVPPP